MTERELTAKRKAELRKIEQENGGLLRPEAVVDFARNPKTALHDVFDWNDTTAAASWRLQQARAFIRVMVQIMPDPRSNDEPLRVRMYTALREDAEGYKYTPELMTTKAGRESVLATALAELESFQEKYAHLQELAGVFAECKRLRAAV